MTNFLLFLLKTIIATIIFSICYILVSAVIYAVNKAKKELDTEKKDE